MIKPLSYLIVALSLTASAHAKEFAASIDDKGRLLVLTDQACRYDKTLPEAHFTNLDGNRLYFCYWFGTKNVYFQSPTHELRLVPKKDFHLVENIV